MKRAYAKSVGKGNPGLDINGKPIEFQTRSIWFSREKLEFLLSQTDEKEGGIRIFLGQYEEETIPEEFSHLKEELMGMLTVILASFKKEEQPKPENFLNGGELCPPMCPWVDNKVSEDILKNEFEPVLT